MGDLTEFLKNSPSDPPEAQLAAAMTASGITPPAEFIMDGHLHRFPTNGQKDDTAGWYVVYPGVVPAGAYGDWRMGETYPFHARLDRELSGFEKQAIMADTRKAKEKAEKERAIKAEEAARAASRLWNRLPIADSNIKYLSRKHIKSHNAKMSGESLVLPLFDAKGNLTSLQFIAPDGTKKYKADGATKGSFWQIGEGRPAYMAEGFATAASIYESTGKPCVVAYSAGNLAPVAMALKSIGVDMAGVTIIADNDESETGEREARKACEAAGCSMKVIPVKGMDANDYAAAGNDLKAFLEGAAMPSEWFRMADEYISQPVPLKWLVRGWVQQEGTSLLHAQPGAGKTFLVLDWLLSIAQGIPWQGCKTKKAGVAYLCGEGYTGLHARLALWRQEHHVDSLGDFAISQTATEIDSYSGITLIHDAMKALPFTPAIVAIDTLNRFMMGDENSAQDTRLFLNNLSVLAKEFRCHFLIVQHEGLAETAQGRARGSSAWRGAVDNEFSLTLRNGVLVLRQCKMKDSEILEPLYLRLEERNVAGWFDEENAPVSSMIVLASDAPPMDPREQQRIAEDIGIIRDAWKEKGTCTPDLTPYISWSNLKEYLVMRKSMTSEAAKKALMNERNRMMGRLIENGIVHQQGSRYLIVDPGLRAILGLLGQESPKGAVNGKYLPEFQRGQVGTRGDMSPEDKDP